MKVLFTTYPWAFETPGGGEIQLLKYEQYLKAAGIAIIRHNPWSKELGRVDLVHFFSCMGGSVHFCNYIKSRGIPLVVSSSLWLTEESKHLYPLNEITTQLMLADNIITNGDVESDRLADILGLDYEKFVTIRNGCDPVFTSKADPMLFRKRFRIEEDFLLNVGNIEPRKNQLNLIRAAKQVGLPLILIGRERDVDYADLCRTEGAGRVKFLGSIDHDDPLLRSAYAACTVFCLPSTLETPGLAALEAAASGARIVITREGSTREYFGDSVHYTDGWDVFDIVSKIKMAIETAPNDSLRQRIAEGFTWEHTIEPLVALYRSLRKD